ncbi:MAG: HD domain-containing protein [Candidatus Hydrogenedentes bacterium]|nr:HD domain-containing protein [Candidatus Hydrogenedentota bacterium]
MEYSERVVEAFALMYELHRTQLRKGSRTPYITHLLGVASLVGGHGGDEEQFIAALLHDAVEDQGGRETLEKIRARFGDDVAGLVLACSDTDAEPKPPWQERKDQFIESVRKADGRVKLIVAADKLHNARELAEHLHERGPEVWKIFKAGKERMLWFQVEMLKALEDGGWRHPILRELNDAMDMLHRTAERVEREAAEDR